MVDPSLPFTEEATKRLLCSFDFEVFFRINSAALEYSPLLVYKAYASRSATKRSFLDLKVHRKQHFLYLEGQVNKMYNGGLLPSLFNLNEVREFTIKDFSAFGDNWAYFDEWHKIKRRKLFWKDAWVRFVKIGSVITVVISAITLYKVFY